VFERAFVLELGDDPDRAEGVVAVSGLDTRVQSVPTGNEHDSGAAYRPVSVPCTPEAAFLTQAKIRSEAWAERHGDLADERSRGRTRRRKLIQTSLAALGTGASG
jgi:hypothetical protein